MALFPIVAHPILCEARLLDGIFCVCKCSFNSAGQMGIFCFFASKSEMYEPSFGSNTMFYLDSAHVTPFSLLFWIQNGFVVLLL